MRDETLRSHAGRRLTGGLAPPSPGPGLLTSDPDIITEYGDDPPFKVPVNLHIGCMGLAPAAPSIINSIPPRPTGGNLDNRRIGVGAVSARGRPPPPPRDMRPGGRGLTGNKPKTMYYPVKVAGGLLSMGDTHLAQGDSELDGVSLGRRAAPGSIPR